MNLYKVILGAVVTEKSAVERTMKGVYTFKVDNKASKELIKKAIETIFDTKVEYVKTLNVSGKKKRMGRYVGRTSSYKKAYVKLVDGNEIAQFEGI